MSDRTPGPWVRHAIEDPNEIYASVDGKRLLVTEVCGNCPEGQDIANAAAIVRWENSFDELVSALENASAFMEGVMQERGDFGVSILIKDARSVLAKVKQ